MEEIAGPVNQLQLQPFENSGRHWKDFVRTIIYRCGRQSRPQVTWTKSLVYVACSVATLKKQKNP